MSEPDVEDFLAHYGVKGMKWGRRRPVDSSTGLIKNGGRTRQETRALNKANKEKFKKQDAAKAKAANTRRVKSIEKARADLKDFDNTKVGRERAAARENLRSVKKGYKADKAANGRVAARRKLNEARGKKLTADIKYSDTKTATIQKASEYKNGKEFATSLLVTSLAGVTVDWSKAS